MKQCSKMPRRQFEAMRGPAGLESISGEWRDMLAGRVEVAYFHRPEWYRAFLGHLCDAPEQVFFCVLRDGQRLVAVAPLRMGVSRLLGATLRTLDFPQDHQQFPGGDFVLAAGEDPTDIASALLEGLARTPALRWDILRFEDVPRSANCAAAFPGLPACFRRRRPAAGRDLVTLDSYATWRAGLATKVRNNLNHSANKLGRAGGGRYVTVSDTAGLGKALDTLIGIEDSGWKGLAGTSIKRNARLKSFYHAIVEGFGDRGLCDIHLLYVRDVPVAANLNIRSGETVYMLKAGYDEQYARLSAGTLLADYAVRYYCEQAPLRTLNLMSDFKYLNIWKPQSEPAFFLSLYNRSLSGATSCGGDLAVAAAEALYHRLAKRVWLGLRRRVLTPQPVAPLAPPVAPVPQPIAPVPHFLGA